MKKITVFLSFLIVLFITYSFNRVSNDEQINNSKTSYLTTNTILIDTKEYDLVEATTLKYEYSKEHDVYIFTVFLENLLPDNEDDYIVSSFTIFSEENILKPGIYNPTSISEGVESNKFSYGSSISTGLNDSNIFLSEGKLEISQNSKNNFEIDYVGESNGKIIKIHYKGELED